MVPILNVAFKTTAHRAAPAPRTLITTESLKDKNGTTAKPPTVVKPPPVKRTSPPSKQRAPKNPVEKVRTPKDKPEKKCTKWFCNSSLKKIVDEIGHSFKLCSAQSCPRLVTFKNVMNTLGYELSGVDQKNFNKATTPK